MSIEIEVVAAGPPGPRGYTGNTGPKGDKGDKGDSGDLANLEIGTVTTGSPAAAHIDGNLEDGYELDLTLPSVGAGSIHDADVSAAADIDRSKIAGTALTSESMGVFNVLDYGAVGDGTTDDTAAIQDAADAASAAGGTVHFPETAAGYKTTDTVTFSSDVDMRGYVKYAGPDGRPAIVVGSVSALLTRRTLRLDAVRATLSDWTSESDIGIQIVNVDSSVIRLVRTDGFTIGAQFSAVGHGTVYNEVSLGAMWNAKVGLDLVAGAAGWVNDNIFFNGTFSCWSSTHPSLSRYGVRLRNTGVYPLNNNVFHKPSFEIATGALVESKGTVTFTDAGDLVTVSAEHGCAVNDRLIFGAITSTTGIVAGVTYYVRTTPSPTTLTLSATPGGDTLVLTTDGSSVSVKGEAVPILLENGSNNNSFNEVRHETTGPFVARVSDTAQYNKITLGYGTGIVDEQAYKATTVLEQTHWAPVSARQVIFHMPDIHKRAAAYDTTVEWGLINVPGMMAVHVSTGVIYPFTSGVMHDGYLDLTGNLGVTVDTRVVTEFLVAGAFEPGHEGRFRFRCRDSAGAVIDPATAITPLIRTSPGCWPSEYYGGVYVGSAGVEGIRFTVCNPDVACVDVFVSNCWITAFEISAYDVQGRLASASTPFPENIVENVANGAPTFGTYTVGRRVYNNAPAAGQPMGWVCTVAGTPGTWKAMGNLA